MGTPKLASVVLRFFLVLFGWDTTQEMFIVSRQKAHDKQEGTMQKIFVSGQLGNN